MSESNPAIQTVRGMHDFLPDLAEQAANLEKIARETFGLFFFREIRTPVLESAALFKRAIGESTDIVEKEMFTLTDRGDRELSLRPEGTAGVVRSYIENNLDRAPHHNKLFYIGPMFRAERPQAGRYREFYQIGAEYFGSPSPGADVEIILLVMKLLRESGLESIELRLNSIGCANCRKTFQEELIRYLNKKGGELCKSCQSRMIKNPLRALDCKLDADKMADAPKSLDYLCGECRLHHEEILRRLKILQIDLRIDHRLVRGLDYYNRTVFEIYPADKAGSQDALAAGGRYDELVQTLGGKSTPAVGFALGLERVLNFLKEKGTEQRASELRHKETWVAWMGGAAKDTACKIVNDLRRNKIPSTMSETEQKLPAQLKAAYGRNVRFCAIIGEDELKKNAVTLKDLKTKEQMEISISDLAGHIISVIEKDGAAA